MSVLIQLLFVILVLFSWGCMERPAPKASLGNESLTIDVSAVSSLTEAENSGDAEAAFKLGLYFDAVANKPDKAIYFFRKAAQAKHPIARYNLGVHLIESKNKAEHDEGVMWLKAAAKDGDADAQQLLKLRNFN